MANISAIIQELKDERHRLDAAIRALETVSRRTSSAGGAPKTRKRRRMSAEARAKIAAAQRARWARQKKAAKSA